MSFVSRCSKAAAIALAAFALSACSELMSRSDFEARVKDKAEHQVRKDIGKPAEVDRSGGDVKWVYVKRTFNVEDGNKFDNRTIVVFAPSQDGPAKVREVQFD